MINEFLIKNELKLDSQENLYNLPLNEMRNNIPNNNSYIFKKNDKRDNRDSTFYELAYESEKKKEIVINEEKINNQMSNVPFGNPSVENINNIHPNINDHILNNIDNQEEIRRRYSINNNDMNLNNSLNNDRIRIRNLNENMANNVNNYIKGKNFFCEKQHQKVEKRVKEEEKEKFISYCKTCNENLCFECEIEHQGHDIIRFTDIKVENYDLKKDIQDKNEFVKIWKKNIKEMIKKINEIIKEIDEYMRNINKFMYNYNFFTKRNYLGLKTAKEIMDFNINDNLYIEAFEDCSILLNEYTKRILKKTTINSINNNVFNNISIENNDYLEIIKEKKTNLLIYNSFNLSITENRNENEDCNDNENDKENWNENENENQIDDFNNNNINKVNNPIGYNNSNIIREINNIDNNSIIIEDRDNIQNNYNNSEEEINNIQNNSNIEEEINDRQNNNISLNIQEAQINSCIVIILKYKIKKKKKKKQ